MSVERPSVETSATPLAGLMLLHSTTHTDHRGSFTRLFCQREMEPMLGSQRPVQVNLSVTREAGTVRGLHFQKSPHAEIKIVRCISGSVFDVAVDLRENSPTFAQWHGVSLTSDNGLALLIPEGFAHGFQTQTPNSQLLYFHTEYYSPDVESGVHCDDPTLAIRWPLPHRNLSARDANLPFLDVD